MQLVCTVEPAADTEFAGQAVHAALPVALLYVFTAHAVHVPPLGPVYPESQKQEQVAA